MTRLRRVLVRVVATGLILAVLALASLYAFAGTYGFNVFFRRGLWVNVAVAPDDARLSASMRLALRDPSGAVTAGPLAWRSIAPPARASSSTAIGAAPAAAGSCRPATAGWSC
jgi:hypothetical protein